MSNYLFYGDNLEVLRKQIKDESIDLCYIDPPFNSKRNYNQIYSNIEFKDRTQAQAFTDIWAWDDLADDGFSQIIDNYQGRFTVQTTALIVGLANVLGKGSLLAYLVSITLRIAEIYRSLKPTGSFYLHCNPTASHYIKLVLDAVFCSLGGNFQNEIIWCYSTGGKSQNRFGRKHDVILYYTKCSEYTFNYMAATIARKPNSHMKLRIDSAGRQYQEKTDKKTGKVYRYYLDEGKIAEDYWVDIETLNRKDKERVGYPTQKPTALLERIIKVSSNEGDVVLDAYCGCGTTAVVAQQLYRSWVGIDISYQSISLVLKRLKSVFGNTVLNQIKLNGIPQDLEAAAALANRKDERTDKEFEKWAVLTYCNNQATLHKKKGIESDIDGSAYFLGEHGESEKIILQVKSDDINLGNLLDLKNMMSKKQAAIAILLTLKEPSSEIIKAAQACGMYQHEVMRQAFFRIQIVSIREIIEQGKRLDIPLGL